MEDRIVTMRRRKTLSHANDAASSAEPSMHAEMIDPFQRSSICLTPTLDAPLIGPLPDETLRYAKLVHRSRKR